MPWGRMHLLYPTLPAPIPLSTPTPTAFPSTPLLIRPLSGGSLQGPGTAETPQDQGPGLI